MPRPVPEYVPGEIHRIILDEGFDSLKDFQKVRLPDVNLYKLCGSTHSRLKKFRTLCILADVSMQSLAEKAERGDNGFIQTLIEKAIEKTKSASKYALQSKARLGNLYDLESRSSYANLLSYKRFADALNLSLDDLARHLFDTENSLIVH